MIEFRLNLPFTYLCTHCLRVCACVGVCVCIHTYLFFFSFVCSLDENSTRCAERRGGVGGTARGVCVAGCVIGRQAGAPLSLSHSFSCCSFTNTHRHTPVCSLFVCFACRVLLFMVLLACCRCCCCRSCCYFCCCPVAVLLLGA